MLHFRPRIPRDPPQIRLETSRPFSFLSGLTPGLSGAALFLVLIVIVVILVIAIITIYTFLFLCEIAIVIPAAVIVFFDAGP